jgi:hypothetical protein
MALVTLALPPGCPEFSRCCPKVIHRLIHSLCACNVRRAWFGHPGRVAAGPDGPRGPGIRGPPTGMLAAAVVAGTVLAGTRLAVRVLAVTVLAVTVLAVTVLGIIELTRRAPAA